MRCRVGDLAVIVRSGAGNEGKVVTVLRFRGRIPGWAGSDRWEVDRDLLGADGPTPTTNTARDSQLRPIRPQDGTDEMLRITGLPREIAHA